MTDHEYSSRYDFLCEKRLRQTDTFLHTCFRNSIFAIDLLLTNYKNIFPFYTNHTFEHSEQVIRYCNSIAGEDIIHSLSPDEIYILLMGASLHDVGMGISETDFKEFYTDIPGLQSYMKRHPNEPIAEYTRVFHHLFSAAFIRKYCALFEIPSEEYLYCICQVVKGHRETDVSDLENYPSEFHLSNGKTVNLAYITVLVKLADELDVAADRNLLFDYNSVNQNWSEKQTMCYQCHNAIKGLAVEKDKLILNYDTMDPTVEREILNTKEKVDEVFAVYCKIVDQYTAYQRNIRQIVFQKVSG